MTLAIFAVALAVRVFVAAHFYGSVDVGIEVEAGQVIVDGGSAWTSKLPAAYFLPALMHLLSTRTGIADSTAQKFPAIAGDLLMGFLLWRFARRRGDERAWVLPAIYLLNPLTVILSAYHGNVDPIMAALLFAALDCRWRGRPLATGLLLALAVAMKPTAILALPVLMLPLTPAAAASVAVPAIVLPIASLVPFAMRDERAGWYLLHYAGPYGRWGISFVLRALATIGVLPALNAAMAQSGKYVTLFAMLVWYAWLSLRRSRITNFELASAAMAATFFAFYAFTFGFGSQYLSLALPSLLIVSRRLTAVYSSVLTPYLIGTYYQETIKEKYHLTTITNVGAMSRGEVAVVAIDSVLTLVAWAMCLWILWRLIGAITSSTESAARG